MGESLETFDTSTALRLNESSDFINGLTIERALHHRIWGGLSPVADLLDPSDPDSATLTESFSQQYLFGISDRDSTTDFPQLFGKAKLKGSGPWMGFVLTPVPAPKRGLVTLTWDRGREDRHQSVLPTPIPSSVAVHCWAFLKCPSETKTCVSRPGGGVGGFPTALESDDFISCSQSHLQRSD